MIINPFDIIKSVEDAYHLRPGTLVSSNRTGTSSKARAVAMYLTRKLTPYSLHEIADHFNKDHSSVVYNCKKVEKWINSTTKEYTKNVIMSLTERFKSEL